MLSMRVILPSCLDLVISGAFTGDPSSGGISKGDFYPAGTGALCHKEYLMWSQSSVDSMLPKRPHALNFLSSSKKFRDLFP